MRKLCTLLLLLAAASWLQPHAHGAEQFRRPVGAGSLYPADPDTLKERVDKLIRDAGTPPDTGRMIACIMPNAAYGFSGAIAAHAVKNIQPGDYEKVVVLGASHFASFENCTLPAIPAFLTPMGFVPLDEAAVDRLNYSPMYWTKAVRYSGTAAHTPIHEREHSVEVVLPFLQARLGIFGLVPILVGDLSSHGRGTSLPTVDAAAEELHKILDNDTLIVVSTNLTHYGEEYNYTPFMENVGGYIEQIDKAALSLITKLDARGFLDYLEKTRNPIPGANAILLLLRVLPPGTTARVVAYDRSGKMLNKPDSDTSVSYAAVQFFGPFDAEGGE